MYPRIIAPFEIIPFEIMNKREANKYFEWFLSIQTERISILSELFESTKKSNGKALDLTPDSLVDLWDWFVPLIKKVEKSMEEQEDESAYLPDWLKSEISIDRMKFSPETEAQIIDIGIYFAAVFLKHFDQLKWGVINKPRNFVDVNQPIVLGFINGKTLNPITVINNCADLDFNKVDDYKKTLLETFQFWIKFIK